MSSRPEHAVAVHELVKRYPTVGMLTTRVSPTSGHAEVAGLDVVADPVGARARLAVVPQRSNLDRSLSVRRNLTFHAAYHGELGVLMAVGLRGFRRRAVD